MKLRCEVRRKLGLTAMIVTAAAIGGCAPRGDPAINPGGASQQPGADVRSLAGTWHMDLSPAGDRSYVKEFVIRTTAASDGAAVWQFTGSVYGGSQFANGVATPGAGAIALAWVSDEAGEMGGPYFWVGVTAGPGVLHGRVRSLERGLEQGWVAQR